MYENVSSNQNNVVPRNVRIEHMSSKIELGTQSMIALLYMSMQGSVVMSHLFSDIVKLLDVFGGTQEIQDS